MIEMNRQMANAFACRMINSIGDSCGNADHTQFADALDPERIDDVILLVEHLDRNVLDVGADRQEIFGKVSIDVATTAAIDQRLFVQS